MMGLAVRHGLSFDLEDWEQNVRLRTLGIESPPSASLHLQVDGLLALCSELGVRATFFVVGKLAQEAPSLIRKVAAEGHEVACHSDRHRLVSSMTRQEFLADTKVAKSRLEDIVGTMVRGYRAPEFSVGSLKHFCFDVLIELGFDYDSSVFPVHGPRYGIPTAPRWPFQIRNSTGSIVELPLLSLRVFGINVPVAGGSWYRLLPRRVLASAVGRAEAAGGTAVLYFHPYEFTSSPLWLHGDGWRNMKAARFVIAHNVGSRRVRDRLRYVVRRHGFGALCELAADVTEKRIS